MTKHQMLYGFHVIKTLLKQNPERILTLYVDASKQDKRLDEIINLAQNANIVPQKTSTKKLTAFSEGAPHQGVAAECRPVKTYSLDELLQIGQDTAQDKTNNRVLLVLDGIQDPHNVGACIRSAEALGAVGVVLVKDRAATLTHTVSKVSSGADQILPITIVNNLVQALKQLQKSGFWVVGMAGDAKTTTTEMDLNGNIALVLGGESKGLRRLTKAQCDHLIKIPMIGQTESLNVSVAAGIGLYELIRKR